MTWKIQALNGIRTNPRPLRYRCNALPTELSKPHESGRVWIRPFMFSRRNTRLKHVNAMVIEVQQWQLNNETMKDANAAITLLEKWPEPTTFALPLQCSTNCFKNGTRGRAVNACLWDPSIPHAPSWQNWGPFLEGPGNLTGWKSDFEIKVSRKVECVLTSNEVYFVSLANNYTVQFSNLLKLSSGMKNKTA